MNLKQLNDIEILTFDKSTLDAADGTTARFLQSNSSSELDKARAVAHYVLEKLGDIEHPILMMDLHKVAIQYKRWMDCFPSVELYYAVKCNPDRVLVSYLQSLGVNFDCATSAEMNLVVNELNHPPDKVIYSNPCKLPSHIRFAADCGVRLTIIDNKDEILKIKRNHPSAQVLLRLACVDTSAQCPMSCKFGATDDKVRTLLEYSAEVGLEVVGVHFHVGSGCSDPQSYHRALVDARRAFDVGIECGHDMKILDLGGGWPGLNIQDGSCRTTSGIHFEHIAAVVNSLLNDLFPNEDNQYKIMAEPGRFFTAGCAFALSFIHSKAVDVGPFGERLIRYYINDGLYGCFNSVLYDHATVRPDTLVEGEEQDDGQPRRATIFGPTCDGFDKVIDDVTHLPEMEIGERLIWLSMGAYTSAASTTFNGFPQAKYYYYKTL